MNKKRLKKQYGKIYREDPVAANLFLLLTEIADEKGQVKTTERELQLLMAARFNKPDEYAFRVKERK